MQTLKQKEDFLRSWFDVPEGVHWAHGMSNEVEKEVSESFDRAIAAWNTRPVAPVEGLETISFQRFHPGAGWVDCMADYVAHYKSVGQAIREGVDRSQAEAIIAAKDKLISDLRLEIESLSAIVSTGIDDVAGASLDDLEADNAALTARVKRLDTPYNPMAEALATDKVKTLEAKLAAAEKALARAAYGFDQIHKSLMSNGPKQASGEVTAFFLAETNAALEAKP